LTSKKEKKHSWKKGLMLLTVILSTVLGSAGLWFVFEKARPLTVAVAEMSETSARRMVDYITTEGWLDGRTIQTASWDRNDSMKKAKFDILVAPWNDEIIGYDLFDLSAFSAETMPRSIRALGLDGDNKRIALPIAIDHVELAFRRDLFEQIGLVVEERVLSFGELDTALRTLVAKDFFPLMVAGGEDRNLLDFVAALTLSSGGLEAYETVARTLTVFDWKTGDIKAFLAASTELTEVLEILRRWKREEILHPEWTNFKTGDVLAVARLRLTAACVMRLSEHRTWPVEYLRNWQSSPFPFMDPRAAGTALLSPVITVSVSSGSRFASKLAPLVSKLHEEKFQESVVQDWGLAPVHNTARAVDREAGDLRFWAAASRRLLSGWDTDLTTDQVALVASAIRELLR